MIQKEFRKQQIAQKMKSLRIEAGLTQSQVAEKLGITYQAVSNYERGKNSIETDLLLAMCEIYGVDPISVLGSDEKSEIYDVLYSETAPLSEKCIAALGLLRTYFARSIGSKDYRFDHPQFDDYVAMLLNQNQFKERFGPEIYGALVQKYGKQPGIPEGHTTYQIEKNFLEANPKKKKSSSLPDEAMKVATRYSKLDRYGKATVQAVIGEEEARIKEQAELEEMLTKPEPKVINLYLVPAAAGYASPLYGSDYEDYELTPEDPQCAVFAIKVQGDSMEPHFPDGSIVFCNHDAMADGDIGVFCLDGESFIKQYHYDRFMGMTYLFSLNRNRADADKLITRTSGQTLTCMGRVITRRRYPIPR